MKKVVVIIGPTASGKTSLSLKLKDLFNFDLINGDSVQVYKELNIGSDKISDEVLKKYPHHLMSIKNLDYNYTVFDYQKDVREKLKELDKPLIVGGSGFYIKSALYDYKFKEYNVDLKQINKIINKGKEYVKKYILKHDKDFNINFLENDRKRERALINILNGKIPSKENNENTPMYDLLLIYLDLDKETLKKNIKKRILNQLERGFLDEVKSLNKYRDKLNFVLGYKEAFMLIENKITKEEYLDILTTHTMKLAKKQKTWFFNKMNVCLFDALNENLLEQVSLKIKEFYDE